MMALVEKAYSWHVVFVIGLQKKINVQTVQSKNVLSSVVIPHSNMAQPSSATVKLLKLASNVSGSEGLSH